jgi:two-component system phosphate regulon response regulator PhoB
MAGHENILIVEDETDLADLLTYHLEREGYTCRRVEDGERAVAEAYRQPPDLIILDRMLPGLSGDDVSAKLKRDMRTAGVPIIMLTAKAADDDELVGFALGADDYIRKPFSVKLLLARVAAVLRRREQAAGARDVLTVGGFVLDHGRHEVVVDGQPLELTATEFRILAALMAARGRVLTREQLIDAAVGHGAAVTNRAMDVHIAALRKKLGRGADYVHTVRGVGYAFRQPEQVRSDG